MGEQVRELQDAAVTVALPIADRGVSYRFYREVFGWEAAGAVADDGVPEPLEFGVNAGLRVMLVPTGGFGWAIGDHEVAETGRSECVFNLGLPADAAVDGLIERARAHGARIVVEPARLPWGYTGTFADPDGHLWSLLTVP
ncbi:VOC family protein [Actinocorallia aurea]